MKRFISRRNVLRGLGVCLTLPWLESLSPRGAQAGEPGVPKRFLLTSFPNGVPTHWWENAPAFGQTLSGADFRLPTILEPFAPLKSKTLMLSRLGNYTWRRDQGTSPRPEIEPSHARCNAAMTTCVDGAARSAAAGQRPSEARVNGISVDQVIVQRANQTTAIPSLQVGLEVKTGERDGFSDCFNNCISWKSDTEPLTRVVSPKVVFDALVAAGATNAAPGQADEESRREAERRAALEKSVIDPVLADANALMKRVSKQDSLIVQQYLDSMRSIERQVTNVNDTMGPGALGCTVIPEPGHVQESPGPNLGLNNGDNGYDHEQHANVMNDLIVMAIQCDLTRVITYMLGDARSEFGYTHIPLEDWRRLGMDNVPGWGLVHHGEQHGSADNTITKDVVDGRYRFAQQSNLGYAAITTWFARKTAELAQRLDAMPEGDGTVLDHTVMMFMSEMRTHDHDGFDLPIVMLGGKGVFRQDAHVAFGQLGQDRQLRDLWYTILNMYFGAGVAAFGEDSRGVENSVLEEILI